MWLQECREGGTWEAAGLLVGALILLLAARDLLANPAREITDATGKRVCDAQQRHGPVVADLRIR